MRCISHFQPIPPQEFFAIFYLLNILQSNKSRLFTNSLASKFSDANSNFTEDRCKSHSNFQFDIITDDYVFDQICNLSNNKSPGLDGFQAKLLKLAAPTTCKPLAYIYIYLC